MNVYVSLLRAFYLSCQISILLSGMAFGSESPASKKTTLHSTMPLEIRVPADIEKADFTALSLGLEIRFGSSPFLAQFRGDNNLFRGATLKLSPNFKPGRFVFTDRGEIWKCVEVDAEKEPQSVDRDDIASVSVNLESANYSSETRTLNAKLPALPYVESQITTVNAVLELAGKSIKMVLKLNKPFNLPPLLAEILKQYSRLGSALINPDFPPSVQWLKTDICGDKHLAQTTFLPCARNDDRTCLVEVGRIDGYRMATANGWIFVAKDSAGEFPFETVGPSHVTFLGDKYELNYLGATKEKDALKASFDVGDFSGCFGAGCGEPSNLREVYVTLKKGVMSTKFGPKK